MSIRMQICWEVLEAAKDAGDAMVIDACRRIINANRIGRDRGMSEWKVIYTFHDAVRA